MSDQLNQKLQQTLTHLYTHAPGFKKRMDDAGLTLADIQTVETLSLLPVLRKDDLIELQKQEPPFGGMLAVPLSSLRRVFQSPGPINEPEPELADAGNWAPGLEAAGFRVGEVAINAFGYHLTPAGASLEDGLRTAGCVVIPGGIGNQEQQIQAMAAFGTTGYVGLPSYLKALLDKADELGYPLKLNKAFVLAEPLPPSLRQELKERGVNVFQAYGTAECGNLGYECEAISGWHIPDDVIVQICDINSGEPLPHGETGEVVVTLLHEHYAIVRFGVGDLSSIIAEPCTCGRSSLRLNGWQGRVGAATKVRGMFLHPKQLADMMARFGNVTAYQAVITRAEHKDFLALHVVLAPGTESATLPATIQQTARDTIKFRLEVEVVDALPPNAPPIRDERTWE
ncbi:MAG: AMP-binding protein [Ardenticatenaceae bacterium]|nr:AMP-binding protein [Anaerolineales bacterium]MCB8923586.1 AMP-binding protein [Ardenticatenaceae bacterium]MCB9003526.1 AMP-binding protein [Ardenticatenaceae bacterium]